MTIRNALIGSMFTVGIAAAVIVGALGVRGLQQNVLREAQERVNNDLMTLSSCYDGHLATMSRNISAKVAALDISDSDLDKKLEYIRQSLDLDILNICDINGNPIAGSYPDRSAAVPLNRDPVIRRVLDGSPTSGTVKLSPERLTLEGGAAIAAAARVYHHDRHDAPSTTDALYWWAAFPLYDRSGVPIAIVYGGRSLNNDYDLADGLRDLLYGEEQYDGKPVGTVTVFMDSVRITTNVLGPRRERAVGTFVSETVHKAVLERGETWSDRAFVVDEWYISGYKPLLDPDGGIIGMLYVGLLEAPYNALMKEQAMSFVVPLLLILAGVIAISLFLVRRIILPIQELSFMAGSVGEGNWDTPVLTGRSFDEINHLSSAFHNMQHAIGDRDKRLTDKNRTLEETNQELNQTNRNYMEMLGFVTHELKSPLASIQTMAAVVLQEMSEEISEDARAFIIRINRNTEELQDMVKNYLDLSRVERGEMEAHKTIIDFRSEVIDPAVDQTTQLFSSRNITLTVESPDYIEVSGDAELLRIALTNYLTNAAKYGREGSTAKITAAADTKWLEVRVWNEGDGFTEEDREKLFQKFSRLRTAPTLKSKGSGLGLFLCRQIMELHDGEYRAESDPGSWAEFGFSIPAGTDNGGTDRNS